MNSNGVLHFSVNGNGRLSLWDTPQTAVSGKEPDEVIVQISLTKPQMALIIRGEMLAKEKAREVLQKLDLPAAYRLELQRMTRV